MPPKKKRNDPFSSLPGASTFGAGRPLKTSRKPVIFKTGPRLYHMGTKPTTGIGGPGLPPPGFITAHNSLDEWIFYWAMAKVTGTPKNPFMGPFLGGETWQYQVPESPSSLGLGTGRVTGGSVSDFVSIGPTGRSIVIRIQTERFHLAAGAMTQMRDLFIRDHLRGVEKVVDVYSQDYLGDISGDAACRVAALALKGIEFPSPIRYRSMLRVRSPLAA